MSHQPYDDFKIFADYDILNKHRKQHINNVISLYDANTVSPILFTDQKFTLVYVNTNFDKIINYYKKV